MVEEFTEFAEKARVSNEEVGLNGGVIWHSARSGGPRGDYDAPLPPGLHISCGIAKIRSHSKSHGGFESDGVSLSVVHIPEEGVSFRTHLIGGAIRSFGYYLPLSALETVDPVIAAILDKAENRPLFSLKGAPVKSVPRLTSVLNDAYHGAVRETLYQARALELTAMVAAELDSGDSLASLSGCSCHIHRVRDYIEANLDKPNRLDELAQANGLSVRTMTSAFRVAFGETISDYLRRRRMEEGAAALESGASVAEAAYLVGYTPNAFSTAFRKHFQRNPSDR